MPFTDIDRTLESLKEKGFEIARGADAHESGGRLFVVVNHVHMSFVEARELDAAGPNQGGD